MRKRKHHRRKRSGLSDPGKRSHRRRRSLSAGNVLSGANIKQSLINTGLGMAGGAGANISYKMITGLKLGTIGNLLVGAGVGVVISAMGAPKIASGFAGGTTALALQAGLSEESNANFTEGMEEGEVYETQDGQLVKMLSDGSVQFLSEEEITALNDNVYPDYSTMNAFQNS